MWGEYWPKSAADYVRDNAGIMKDKEIAARLTQITGRVFSIHVVRHKRNQMGIYKKKGQGVNEIDKDYVPKIWKRKKLVVAAMQCPIGF